MIVLLKLKIKEINNLKKTKNYKNIKNKIILKNIKLIIIIIKEAKKMGYYQLLQYINIKNSQIR